MQMSRLSHVDAFDHTMWLYEMFELQFRSELRLCRCRTLSLLAFSCVGLQLIVSMYIRIPSKQHGELECT